MKPGKRDTSKEFLNLKMIAFIYITREVSLVSPSKHLHEGEAILSAAAVQRITTWFTKAT